MLSNVLSSRLSDSDPKAMVESAREAFDAFCDSEKDGYAFKKHDVSDDTLMFLVRLCLVPLFKFYTFIESCSTREEYVSSISTIIEPNTSAHLFITSCVQDLVVVGEDGSLSAEGLKFHPECIETMLSEYSTIYNRNFDASPHSVPSSECTDEFFFNDYAETIDFITRFKPVGIEIRNVYCSALLEAIFNLLLDQCARSSSMIFSQFAPTLQLIPIDIEEPVETLHDFKWAYIASISESSNLRNLLFPLCYGSVDLVIYKFAAHLRSRDRKFLEFIKSRLLERTADLSLSFERTELFFEFLAGIENLKLIQAIDDEAELQKLRRVISSVRLNLDWEFGGLDCAFDDYLRVCRMLLKLNLPLSADLNLTSAWENRDSDQWCTGNENPKVYNVLREMLDAGTIINEEDKTELIRVYKDAGISLVRDRDESLETLSELGDLYLQAGKLDEAIQCYESAIVDANSREDLRVLSRATYFGLGEAYALKGELEKSFDSFLVYYELQKLVEYPTTLFDSSFSGQGVQRTVDASDIHVVTSASTRKKELTEKQKELIARVKSGNKR